MGEGRPSRSLRPYWPLSSDAARAAPGNLTEKGQHWRSESVAELGGAVLLEALGEDHEADRGGCYEYIEHYAKDAGIDPVQACMSILKRTCDAVDLLLTEAETLAQTNATASV